MITDHAWAPQDGWDAPVTPESSCIWCKEPKASHATALPPATARDKLLPIMFWGHAIEIPKPDRGGALLVGLLVGLFMGRLPDNQPKDFVRTGIPRARRELAAKLLASGKIIESYFGDANCRICGEVLGNKDLAGYGMLWPEKAEHYVLEHDVWVPGLDRLIERSGN